MSAPAHGVATKRVLWACIMQPLKRKTEPAPDGQTLPHPDTQTGCCGLEIDPLAHTAAPIFFEKFTLSHHAAVCAVR
eukprot:1524983-Rhodomonas_salina.2